MYKLILSRCYLYNRAVSNIQCPEFSHFTRIFEFSRQKPCSSNKTFLVIFKRHEKLKHHCLTDFLKSYHFLTLARFSRIVTYLAKRDAIHIHSHVQALHVLPGEPPLWQSSPQRGKGYWPKGFLQLPSSNVSCGSLASTNHPLPSSTIYYFMKLRKLFPQ